MAMILPIRSKKARLRLYHILAVTSTTLLICCWYRPGVISAGEPLLRLVRAAKPGPALILNGDFEQIRDTKLQSWATAPQGFALGLGEGRDDSNALRCDN